MPVICICLSPGYQRSALIETLVSGEVNRIEQVFVDVSGKGVNVCRVLHRLGVEAVCLAQGGSNADELMSLAKQEGLDLRLTPSAGRLRTCTSIVETSLRTGRRVTELVEPNSEVDMACVEAFTQTVAKALPTATALVIAGSMAPGFPKDYLARLASLAKQAGVPVCMDIQGAALREAIVSQPAVVKINLAEFAATFLPEHLSGGEHSGILAESSLSPQVLDAVAEVSRQHACTFVLTRGARSILIAQHGAHRVVPVSALAAHETLNPIGSGDAFLAGMLAHLLSAKTFALGDKIPLDSLEEAINLATACAQSNARTARPGFLEESFLC